MQRASREKQEEADRQEKENQDPERERKIPKALRAGGEEKGAHVCKTTDTLDQVSVQTGID